MPQVLQFIADAPFSASTISKQPHLLPYPVEAAPRADAPVCAAIVWQTDPLARLDGRIFEMKLFDKDFYRALMVGFLIGTAGMALSVGAAQVHAESGGSVRAVSTQ
ncbi:hypothetical protein [Novosphingobium sp. FKTRR1]|uniref:hypothetical protein n=1 Tax=unclassified Novosphingobium TaxID=2644732 RepID=UPI001CEFE3B8|nr:hypothetical protein [Novosphingobium sp. FKTRR1]